MQDRLVLIMPPEHPLYTKKKIYLKDLLSYPLLLREKGSAGLGISLLPEQLVKEDILAGRIVSRDVEDENFIRTNYILWHKNKYITPSFTEFIDLCKKISDD